MTWFGFLPLIVLIVIGECAGRQLHPLPSKVAGRHVKPLQTICPYNIAHRGSNGEFPEESVAAYKSFLEITSDSYFNFIKNYVVGIGPWRETIVPSINNYLTEATDLVARAHAHGLQVHPYTFRNENLFLHFNFSQDPYEEYNYWINKIKVDGLFTDFAGRLHNFQEWTSHQREGREGGASKLLHKIAKMISSYKGNEKLH